MEKQLKLYNNHEIDYDRWDQVVRSATNSRVYAESWYLDMVAHNWKGLIYGDYEYVMPLHETKKWGIVFVCQPVYAQQQGIFPTATPAITAQFIELLKKKYRYFNISLNALNVSLVHLLETEVRKNYVLNLNSPLNEIRAKYDSHTARYTKKSRRECTILEHVAPSDFMKLKLANGQKSFKPIYRQALQLIMNKSRIAGRSTILGAYSQRNELIAAAFFLKAPNRYIYLNSISTDEGKKARAMFAIVDHFIEMNANSPFVLDFEGSNIEGIARFFAGFGAYPETYQNIKHNNLPWPLNLIKK